MPCLLVFPGFIVVPSSYDASPELISVSYSTYNRHLEIAAWPSRGVTEQQTEQVYGRAEMEKDLRRNSNTETLHD